jgi:H+-translocating NAD(P) transhydrogenase subunit beta
MTSGLVIAAFVVAAVCFIYSLGGLSQHETSKRGIWFGVAGMALAVLAQLLAPGIANYWLMLPMMIVGAVLGYYVAARPTKLCSAATSCGISVIFTRAAT